MPTFGKASVRVKLDAFSKVVDRAMLKLAEVIESKKSAADAEIKSLAANAIRDSAVFQGIVGDSPSKDANDLQAHFGLRPDWAASAGEQLITHVIRNMRTSVVVRRPRKGFTTVEFRATGFLHNDYSAEDLENKHPFLYPSEKKVGKHSIETQLIPWLTWVMNGGRTDAESTNPGISDYFIDFRSPSKSSRSGRASMRSIITKGGNTIKNVFPYTLPTLLVPKNARAKNFIDDIFMTAYFRSAVAAAMGHIGRTTVLGGVRTRSKVFQV